MTSSVQTLPPREHAIVRAARESGAWHPSVTHMHALASIANCVQYRKGYVSLLGEPGSGKSSVLRMYAALAWQCHVRTVFVQGRSLSNSEFLREVLAGMRIQTHDRDDAWLRRRFQFASQLHLACDKPLVLLIDDAHLLPETLLSQFHLLLDSSAGQERVLQIVMAGREPLGQLLQSPLVQPLTQRITTRCTLHPLEPIERLPFIAAVFGRGGEDSHKFLNNRSLRRIARRSKGNPRELRQMVANELMRQHGLTVALPSSLNLNPVPSVNHRPLRRPAT
jgi:general secretion pathway protein A